MKKQTIVAITIIPIIIFNFAQANISRHINNEIITSNKPAKITKYKKQTPANNTKYNLGLLDTLNWCDDDANTDFGGWSGNYFAQYFVPQTECILNSITFNMSDLPDESGGKLTIWICKSNYSWPELNTLEIADSWYSYLGYYSSSSGVSPFGTNWIYGDINKWPGADTTKRYDPLGELLTDSITIEIEPIASDSAVITVDLDNFGWTSCDTLFILVRLDGFPLNNDSNDLRFGFVAQPIEYEPMPFLKFYNNTYTMSERPPYIIDGWYIKSYALDWRLAVEYVGGRPPKISDMTELHTTLSTEPREVYASASYSGYHCGVPVTIDSMALYYSANGEDFQYSIMELVEGSDENYLGLIPGFAPGTDITYYVSAQFSDGLEITSMICSYSVFSKGAESDILLLGNGPDEDGIPGAYYLIDWHGYSNMDFNFDWWAYGAASAELLDLYDCVVEVTQNGPASDNIDAIQTWLAQGNKNYMLAGDEILGAYYGWPGETVDITDSTDAISSFFKYLGVTAYHGDLAASEDSLIEVFPVENDVISGALFDSVGTLICDTKGWLGLDNWIDAVTPTSDATTFLTAVSQAPAYGTDPLAVGVYREDATLGNKMVFMGCDPISLIEYIGDTFVWWGNTPFGPVEKALEWFGKSGEGIEDEPVAAPKVYSLNQNYPNPFNPLTTIEYEIPDRSMVEISIYDIQGRLVENLVNKNQSAGKYSIQWDASNYSSGVYFYKIQADEFQQTRKMILIK